LKLNPISRISKTFTHDTKAVVGGQRVVFRTIAGYAKGNVDVMIALAKFFARPISHAVLLPASSLCKEDDHHANWDDAVTLAIGEQVWDELGRVFEIQRSLDGTLYLKQMTLTH
jgi:hypothetical protein